MVAENDMVYDGHKYKKGDELPDLGKWECVDSDGNKREYRGLSSEATKLPTEAQYPQYKDLASDSIAYCVDTQEVYMYFKPDDRWYPQQ